MKEFLKKITATLSIFFSNRDHVAKVLSLILAFILWSYIANSRVGDIKIRVSVEKLNLPDNIIVTEIDPESVLVRIEGKKDLIRSVSHKNVIVYVDLKEIEPGQTREFPLNLVKRDIPDGVTIALQRSTALVSNDAAQQKSIRVVPRITGKINQGILIGKPRVEPQEIIASGPSRVVRDMQFIYTDEIDLSGISNTLEKKVSLEYEPVKGLTLNFSQVNVTVPVTNYGELPSQVIPIGIEGGEKGLIYTPSVDNVTVYYRVQEGVDVQADFFEAVLDVTWLDTEQLAFNENGVAKVADVSIVLRASEKADSVEVVTFLPDEISLIVTKKE